MNNTILTNILIYMGLYKTLDCTVVGQLWQGKTELPFLNKKGEMSTWTHAQSHKLIKTSIRINTKHAHMAL